METQSLAPKRGGAPLPNFRPISIVPKTARCIKMPLGMEVGLSPGEFVLDGDPLYGVENRHLPLTKPVAVNTGLALYVPRSP